MKLTYWAARRTTDNECYSIVAKTKKEAVEKRNESPDDYEQVEKVVVHYDDAFDLMSRLTGEGGGRMGGV